MQKAGSNAASPRCGGGAGNRADHASSLGCARAPSLEAIHDKGTVNLPGFIGSTKRKEGQPLTQIRKGEEK
jgi:hypothetical protein